MPVGAVAFSGLQEYATRTRESSRPCADAVEIRERFEDGSLRVHGWLVAGLRHGIWREWHVGDILASETLYVLGKREGVSLSCYRDGFPKAVRNFVDDIEHGLRLIWYRDGTHWQEIYARGVRNGLWREYVDSKLRTEGTYVANVKVGPWRTWDAVGRPNGIVTYPGKQP